MKMQNDLLIQTNSEFQDGKSRPLGQTQTPSKCAAVCNGAGNWPVCLALSTPSQWTPIPPLSGCVSWMEKSGRAEAQTCSGALYVSTTGNNGSKFHPLEIRLGRGGVRGVLACESDSLDIKTLLLSGTQSWSLRVGDWAGEMYHTGAWQHWLIQNAVLDFLPQSVFGGSSSLSNTGSYYIFSSHLVLSTLHSVKSAGDVAITSV